MITLRPYQEEAVDAVLNHWRRHADGCPLIEVPTGGGKSAILGELTRRICGMGARVAVVTHRAELIEQDAAAIRAVWPGTDVGIYSASVGERRVRQATVAGIQSVYRRPAVLGRVDCVIVDEAHLINPKASTQYARLLSALRKEQPDLGLAGLTATPYRLGRGMLTHGEGALFTSVVYRVRVLDLVEQGYLSPLVTRATAQQIDTSGARTSGGEWVASDLELAVDIDSVTDAVAQDVAAALAAGRRAALVYGVTVAHAAHLRNALRFAGVSCEMISGETPRAERVRTIDAFKRGELRCIASCDVLTTGFDAPIVDVIALVRPTQSPGLYVQILGRGMRLYPGKRDCLVLDYGGNIARHGPITDIKTPGQKREGSGEAPTKTCPDCSAEVAASVRVCPWCDHEWPPPERKANRRASTLDPMAPPPERSRHTVGRAEVYRHESTAKGTVTMRVDYWSPTMGSILPSKIASEWVCFEHEGFARRKAEKWWSDVVGTRVPATVDEALDRFESEAPEIASVTTEPDGKYTRVVAVEIVRRDEAADELLGTEDDEPMSPADAAGLDELPF